MTGGKKAYYRSIPRSKDLAQSLPALTENIEILTGARGNGLDKAVTRRELLASGAFRFQPASGGTIGGSGGNLIPVAPDTDGRIDYPNAPEGLQVTGGFTFIMVEWDAPTFAGFAYAEIWRAAADLSPGATPAEFGSAVRVATTQATVYIDPVELESAYYYWIRFVNRNDEAGPINATAGTLGQTARDINKIQAALESAITENQFAAALNSRIELIDGGELLPGSVNARILSEAQAREDGDNTIAEYVDVLQLTVNGNTSSIATLQTLTDGLSAQYMVKLDVNGYVTGFGLFNEGPGASGFLIHTDFFAVGKPGQTTKYPFIIGTVNGLTTIVLDAATFIADATITTAKIRDLAVDFAKIADLAVGSAKIANLAVTTAKIEDLAVTAAKIGYLAVGTAQINDAAITAAKIGNAEVGTLKIANEAVTVPAGSSIYYGGFIPNSWITIDYVDVNWGGNPPAAVMVSAFCNYEPQSGDSLSVALRVAVSINGGADITAGDVGLSAVNGYSVIANTSWRFTGQSGSCRYKIQVFASTGGKYKAGGCGITVLGVRR